MPISENIDEAAYVMKHLGRDDELQLRHKLSPFATFDASVLGRG